MTAFRSLRGEIILKKSVFEANQLLPKLGLVKLTWGNVSAIDRSAGIVYIKPSGVDYSHMQEEDIVAVELDSGKSLGKLKPSSDTNSHLEVYRRFHDINSIVHTHSTWATVWAQMGKGIPALGTTHADYFYGEVPCSRALTSDEILNEYELNTGKVICETINALVLSRQSGAVLVREHGPFCWGRNPIEAVEVAVVLEEIAKMAFLTQWGNPNLKIMDSNLLDKHYYRKHGKNAYYGQR